MPKRFPLPRNAKYVDVGEEKIVYTATIHQLENLAIAHGYTKPLFEAVVPGIAVSDEYDNEFHTLGDFCIKAVDVEPIADRQLREEVEKAVKETEGIDEQKYRTKFIFW